MAFSMLSQCRKRRLNFLNLLLMIVRQSSYHASMGSLGVAITVLPSEELSNFAFTVDHVFISAELVEAHWATGV